MLENIVRSTATLARIKIALQSCVQECRCTQHPDIYVEPGRTSNEARVLDIPSARAPPCRLNSSRFCSASGMQPAFKI